MSKMNVEYLEPGMELTEDVRGSNGLVLLGAGAEISERHIQIFKTWGIGEVEVKSDGAANTAPARELTETERAAIEAELDRMFQHNDALDPVIEELRRLCTQRETLRVTTQK